MIALPLKACQGLEIVTESLVFENQATKKQIINLLEKPHSKTSQMIRRSLFPVPVLILLVLIFGLLLELNLAQTTEEATESSIWSGDLKHLSLTCLKELLMMVAASRLASQRLGSSWLKGVTLPLLVDPARISLPEKMMRPLILPLLIQNPIPVALPVMGVTSLKVSREEMVGESIRVQWSLERKKELALLAAPPVILRLTRRLGCSLILM